MTHGFTKAQQVIYRALVKRAWAVHCSHDRMLNEKNKAAHEQWYRATLFEAVGVYTTKDCNRKGDFERAMAGFEAVIGDSIYWQRRADEGPLRRARHALRELMEFHDITDSYVAGVAAQMFDTHHSNLDSAKLEKVIAALKIDMGRHAEPVVAAPAHQEGPF